MNNKKINITSKGQEQLEEFKNQQVNILLNKIVKAKFYPGLEEIEVSGNDINEFSKNFFYRDNLQMARRKRRLMLLASFYTIIGLILALGGFYYDTFMDLLQSSPERAMLIMSGVIIFFIGIFAQLMLLFQSRKYRRID